ncbi:hypothetical protein ACFWA9_29140 [Kitasatospora sp. NPDC059973]|uniref:hypothetical protein n=1 Tax=Kitasatospora sp. NPDC059973 TaxID=3347020 RepID=UPI0036BCB2F2
MTTSRGASPLLARARAWGGDPRRAGRRLLVWLLLAVPVGLLAGEAARGVSWLIGQVAALELPGPLALFPGLLLLLLALSCRGMHETFRPPVGEVWWFLTVAGVSSLFALA